MIRKRFGIAFPALATLLLAASAAAQSDVPGQVYTTTNAAEANEVAVFTRAADGTVAFDTLVPTGGLGTGTPLGSQSAVVLTPDERWLLVVNAGSNDVSSFRVLEDSIELVGVFGSRGVRPVSIAVHDDLVYVLNAGNDRIAGFRLRDDGALKFLKGSKKKLSGNGTQPAQIGFAPDGSALFVTEKETDRIVRFAVKKNGKPGKRQVIPSLGATPFGFAFGLRDQLFVTEAADAADGASTISSYETLAGGGLEPLTPTLGTTQTAACWVVLTPDRRLAFTANTGSDSVSLVTIGFDGTLTLTNATAAATGDAPSDLAITRDGRFLYVLESGLGSIGDHVVGLDGVLAAIPGDNALLPTSAAGLAAR